MNKDCSYNTNRFYFESTKLFHYSFLSKSRVLISIALYYSFTYIAIVDVKVFFLCKVVANSFFQFPVAKASNIVGLPTNVVGSIAMLLNNHAC